PSLRPPAWRRGCRIPPRPRRALPSPTRLSSSWTAPSPRRSSAALVDPVVAVVVEAVAGLLASTLLVGVDRHAGALVAAERGLDARDLAGAQPIAELAVERDRAVDAEDPAALRIVRDGLAVDPHAKVGLVLHEGVVVAHEIERAARALGEDRLDRRRDLLRA